MIFTNKEIRKKYINKRPSDGIVGGPFKFVQEIISSLPSSSLSFPRQEQQPRIIRASTTSPKRNQLGVFKPPC